MKDRWNPNSRDQSGSGNSADSGPAPSRKSSHGRRPVSPDRHYTETAPRQREHGESSGSQSASGASGTFEPFPGDFLLPESRRAGLQAACDGLRTGLMFRQVVVDLLDARTEADIARLNRRVSAALQWDLWKFLYLGPFFAFGVHIATAHVKTIQRALLVDAVQMAITRHGLRTWLK